MLNSNLGSTALTKTFFAFGLNYKTAPVAVREKLYLHEAEIPQILSKFKEYLSECFVLSTCNRTEVYAVSDSAEIDVDFYKQILIDFKDANDIAKNEHFFTFVSCVATKHLFRVVSSIDSQVIGDSQIMRQVRNAYSIASEHKSTGKILNQLLQRAFKLGKRACSETAIRGGAVSISLAAVKQAFDTFGSLDGLTVMVIGAGETARLVTEALANKRVGKILVANRTFERARQLVEDLKASHSLEIEVVDFNDFRNRLSDVDIVISSTGSAEPVLRKSDLAGVVRRMLLIDIAVPRDIDPSVNELPEKTLKNVDDLNSVVDRDHQKRLSDVPKVKKMIVEEMVDYLTWYYSLSLMPEYKKIGIKPSAQQRDEALRVKEFLAGNMSEIHRLALVGAGSFQEDLAKHFSLIRNLQRKKYEEFMEAAA